MNTLDLINRFTHHPVQPGQDDKYDQIQAKALEFAMLINRLCPESREKSLAITELEKSMFFADAAIARNEKPDAPSEKGDDLPFAVAGDAQIP